MSQEVKDMITLHNKSLREKRSPLKANMHQFYEAMGIDHENEPHETNHVHFDACDVILEDQKSTQVHQTKNEYHSNKDDDDTILMDYLSGKIKPEPGDIRQVLAAKSKKKKDAPTEAKEETVTLNGHRFHKLNMHRVTYRVTAHDRKSTSSLIDRGANGGLTGSDVRLLQRLE